MTKMSGTFLNSGACDAGPQGEGKESPSNTGRLQTAGRNKYQPYPEYKDSGVEWLGIVPNHWDVCSLKRYIVRNDGGVWGNDPLGVDDTIVLRSTEQTVDGQWIIEQPALRQLSQNEKASSLLVENDLVVTKSSGSTIHIGKTTLVTSEIAELQCCYSNFMQRIRLHCSFLPKLAWYIMNNLIAREQFNVASNSTIGLANLNSAMIGQLLVVVPTEPEQRTIAAFLDYETARIDQLIAKQQQLIELLKEKRQAVISHAVTKGLNPNAPMKDSGVEWLGQVPEHWEAVRVKQVSTFITSGPRGWSDFIVDDGDEIFLQSGDLNNQLGIDLVKAKKVFPPKNAEGVRTKLNNGDVLVCITGANTGRVAVANKIQNGVYINQHLSLIRPKNTKVESYYLGLCLSSSVGRSFFDVVQYGLKEGLSLGNISEAPLALPPKNEQSLIISYIENINHRFSLLSNSACNQVELLKERRTALISAAVTGKIDLRGWQPPKREVTA